jgi:hypothetical protein
MVPPVGKHPYSLIRDDLRIPPVVLFVAIGSFRRLERMVSSTGAVETIIKFETPGFRFR